MKTGVLAVLICGLIVGEQVAFANECRPCHADHFTNVVTHFPAIQGQCYRCHQATPAHLSGEDVKAVTTDRRSEACYACHDKEIQTQDRLISNIKIRIEQMPFVHGGVQAGCQDCHLPHGSRFNRLLTASYPLSDHAVFSLETYGICFKCHDSAMVQPFVEPGLTGFRNGSLNLHWLHVTNGNLSTSAKMGRSCGVCHDPHAASQPHNLRSSFGPFPMPLVYRAQPRGGECTRACHVPKSYTR